jgi:hypothetical protein
MARLITAANFDGETGLMWFAVVLAAAIVLVAGLGLAFVQMAHRAHWRVRQHDLAEQHSRAQLGAIRCTEWRA